MEEGKATHSGILANTNSHILENSLDCATKGLQRA